MKLSLIAARALNNVIGNDAEIPWHARGEQKLFKTITMDGVLLMGRKTFDSIGRALPGRVTVVITRDKTYQPEGAATASSIETALALGQTFGKPIFIAGGAEIYRQTLPMADVVHLTTVDCEPQGNIFFPEFPTPAFALIEEKHYESNINYTYQLYKRINNEASL